MGSGSVFDLDAVLAAVAPVLVLGRPRPREPPLPCAVADDAWKDNDGCWWWWDVDDP
jgi:hypothetical protein